MTEMIPQIATKDIIVDNQIKSINNQIKSNYSKIGKELKIFVISGRNLQEIPKCTLQRKLGNNFYDNFYKWKNF